jgi:hypothetical protein
MSKAMVKLLGGISLITVLGSCNTETEELSPSLRREADSTFNSLTSKISEKMDSICDRQFDSMVQVKFDSIVKERRKKIERLSKPQ